MVCFGLGSEAWHVHNKKVNNEMVPPMHRNILPVLMGGIFLTKKNLGGRMLLWYLL